MKEFQQSEEIFNQVFDLGNLVHGTSNTSEASLKSFLNDGIKTPVAMNRSSQYGSEKEICLGMMIDSVIDMRYKNASHRGPIYHSPHYHAHEGRIAFIVSLKKIIEIYFDNTFAIGKNFWDKNNVNKFMYGLVIPWENAFGLKVMHPGKLADTVYETEVRVYATKNCLPVITPSMFLALVVLTHEYEKIKRRLEKTNHNLSLPIFSHDMKFLGYTDNNDNH